MYIYMCKLRVARGFGAPSVAIVPGIAAGRLYVYALFSRLNRTFGFRCLELGLKGQYEVREKT
jgi:hypothetical protein